MANESADIALDFDREKKRLPNEFWKKKNGDRSKINSPILRQRYGLKFSHHPYLTHLNIMVNMQKLFNYSQILKIVCCMVPRYIWHLRGKD